MENDFFASEFPDANGLPFGSVALADNLAMGARIAAREAEARGLHSPEALAAALKVRDRPHTFRPNDPHLLADAPPLYGEAERKAYAIFKTAYSIKQHGNTKELRSQIETFRRNIVQNHGLDIGEYLSYCFASIPGFGAFFLKKPHQFTIPERYRNSHTYLTGKSGSGKSEALKVLIHGTIAEGSAAVVLVDPHGDLATDVARYELNRQSGRLVFLDPRLAPGYAPGFNPFDIPDELRTPEAVDLAAENLLETFGEMLKGSGFTAQMETVLRPVITTLLLRPGSTILDVLAFLDDDRNDQLKAFAYRHLANPAQIDFLRHEFGGDNYASSKDSIAARIRSFTNSLTFYETMTGPATVRLSELIDARKVVVISLCGGMIGQATADTLARFVLASVRNAALARQIKDAKDRVPCHVYIDECQLFVTDSIERILNETRKYKYFLTLAQQIPGGGIDSADAKKALYANTGIKIVGANDPELLAPMARRLGVEVDEIAGLPVGRFFVKPASEVPSVCVRVPSHLAHGGGGMSAEAWEEEKARQIARYYRPTVRNAPGHPAAAPIVETSDDMAESPVLSALQAAPRLRGRKRFIPSDKL